ncbi:hypothetical protein CAPTEDRAFT_200941 [Capitella teleta]|uniref:Protein kinase domain-containing protein n=1 Tax=Capitella teleta TaxID=283909 RepID=R7T451_CAPTE|nr:hypothetical protein CAPTEDRAFT_200941 [Capitella teleta]|eukprot:ELT87667.1 hypothetical protein CAPTEDRAFT_200941 [Capitella teleta]
MEIIHHKQEMQRDGCGARSMLLKRMLRSTLLAILIFVLCLCASQLRTPGSPRTTKTKSIDDVSDRFFFTCSNVGDIQILALTGRGVTKHVYRAQHDGEQIAVKMVIPDSLDVQECVRQCSNEHQIGLCRAFPNMKLMKEILLLIQLNHRNLLQLLGYCVRSEEITSLSTKDHGVLGVYEFAKTATSSIVQTWSLTDRLKSAWELLDLLSYLEHSPLGSLLLADLKRSHLLLRPPHSIVITDLDDVSAIEPECSNSQCIHPTSCVDGRCVGSNARHNMVRLYDLIISQLLSCSTGIERDKSLSLQQKNKATVVGVTMETSRLCRQIHDTEISAAGAASDLENIMTKLNDES